MDKRVRKEEKFRLIMECRQRHFKLPGTIVKWYFKYYTIFQNYKKV